MAVPCVWRENKADGPNYFTLHFALEFQHAADRVYLAFCYPFTYTDLQCYLRGLPETHPRPLPPLE
jgi:hypothetical protein